MHDDVFRLNLILNGGWTKDTFHILEELIELALKQQEWNKRFGHLSDADRKTYYKRRAERFANKRRGSDEQQVRRDDRVHPTREEEALPSGLNNELLRRQRQVEALGKEKGIGKASQQRTGMPDPAEQFSIFWDQGDAARWGYPSVPECLQDKTQHNLPFQRCAPGGAAGSAHYVGPYRPDQIFNCLQCNEPSAIVNLWKCDRCTMEYKEDTYFHGRSMNKNCYEEHTHYCESKALYGWKRYENKRGNISSPAVALTSW